MWCILFRLLLRKYGSNIYHFPFLVKSQMKNKYSWKIVEEVLYYCLEMSFGAKCRKFCEISKCWSWIETLLVKSINKIEGKGKLYLCVCVLCVRWKVRIGKYWNSNTRKMAYDIYIDSIQWQAVYILQNVWLVCLALGSWPSTGNLP